MKKASCLRLIVNGETLIDLDNGFGTETDSDDEYAPNVTFVLPKMFQLQFTCAGAVDGHYRENSLRNNTTNMTNASRNIGTTRYNSRVIDINEEEDNVISMITKTMGFSTHPV